MRQISLAAARRTALAAQGFAQRSTAGTPGIRRLQAMYERIALVQIDSVNILTRAHYLPAFSRLGAYDRATLGRLEHPHRRVFEYWGHMASYSPIEHHRLLRWRMDDHRRSSWPMIERVATQRPEYVEQVRRTVAERGPLTGSQIDPSAVRRRGQMWSWHDGRAALEYLFRTGELASVRRNSQFERELDLAERVLPAAVLNAPTPSRDDAQRELLAIAARAHGIGTLAHLRDYYRLRGRHLQRLLDELVEDGVIEPVRVTGTEGVWYRHRDARTPRSVPRSALLSPFDPLVWERGRTLHLWDLHYRIEIYTPRHKRVFGYYVLPYLLDEQIAALVDLKADRAAGVLRVLAAHHRGSLPAEYVAHRLCEDLHSMASWLDLDDVVVRDAGDLARALRSS